MAPVLWFLVLHKNGSVSTEYRVLDGRFPPDGSLDEDWDKTAILRIDENENWIVPF